MEFQKNQLLRELLGSTSLNPFAQHTSSSRQQMFAASHLGQMLVIEGSTPRTVFTGMEKEFGKYTFCVEMPADGLIVAIIPRYPKTLAAGSIAHNPETLVIYENADTKELGCFSLVDYCSRHQYFGYRFRQTADLSQLRVGAYIQKGTKFLQSPSISKDGDYRYGTQANIAFMTVPGVAEDGVVVSESFRKKLRFRSYATRVIQWGTDKFPLNLYGTPDKPRAFPDIGEKIRDDGILMALRSYDPAALSPLLMLPKMMREPRVDFDEMIYADGPGGVVVDIRINHSSTNTDGSPPNPMDDQPMRYDAATRSFYQSVMDVYSSIQRKRGAPPRVSPELDQVVVDALQTLNDNQTPRIIKHHRRQPLDIYRVEIVLEYVVTPNIGFKLTDCHGGKGVICKILPDEHMPVDAAGNRAELIMDPNATVNRANVGRLYEQYLCGSSRDTYRRMCDILGVKYGTKKYAALDHILTLPLEKVQEAWNLLLGFYAIVSPQMHRWILDGTINTPPEDYLADVVDYNSDSNDPNATPCIRIYFPTESEVITPEAIAKLESMPQYQQTYGPVSYVGNSGLRRVTKNSIRIAPIYIIELEKTGEDWGAVASGRLQHHGLLAPLTRSDKYSSPARLQGVRGIGEAELRNLVAFCGSEAGAELMDRNGSPSTHQHEVEQMLRSDKPSAIENLVDRNVVPFGTAQPVVIMQHLLYCSGLQFQHSQYTPDWLQSPDEPVRVFEAGQDEPEVRED